MGARAVGRLETPTGDSRAQEVQRVRVVYVLANEGYGGSEVHLRGLVAGLDRELFDPTVLLSPNEPMGVLAKDLRQAGVPVGFLPIARPFDLSSIVDLVRLFRVERPDVVHIQMPSPLGGLAAFVAARWAGVPVVVSTEHSHAHHFRAVTGVRGHWLRVAARLRMRLSDRAIAVSAGQQISFCDVLGVRPEKMTVLPNGVDPSGYSRDLGGPAVRSDLGVPTSVPVAGMVTAFAEYERTEDFIRAADHVAAALPTAHFLIAGGQHPTVVNEHAVKMRSDLERLADAFGLAERVHFLGYRTDMAAVMAALDVFVLPARYKSFGIVLLEAMASGVPVVATAAGGVPEVVQDSETGLLVPPLDPPALATAMLNLLTNKNASLRMGRRGRRRVERLFTTTTMIERTCDLYLSLLERRARRPTGD